MLTFRRRTRESDSQRDVRDRPAPGERASGGGAVSALPPGGEGRGGARRILSSVSEVASELARVVSAEPAELYRVAREVVAEELGRVKQGFESAPLETLVKRAQRRLEAAAREQPRVSQPDLFAEAPPEPPRPGPQPAPPMPVLPALYEAPEEPFAPASRSDLGWDRGGDVPTPEALAVAPPPLPEQGGSGDERTLPVEAATSPEAAEIPLRENERGLPPPLPGSPTRRGIWIAVVLGFAAVAVVVGWLLVQVFSAGTGVLKSETPQKVEVPPIPTRAPEAAPTPAPVPTMAAAVPTHAPTRPAEGSKPAKVASFVTKDWAGRAPVFILHFSSHQERTAAVSEATRLAAAFRKPGHAVEVDLGAKGVWYRVVIGEFRTADEAKSFRAALAAKNTPGMGHVYQMRGAR